MPDVAPCPGPRMPLDMNKRIDIGAIVIGRNEGKRLLRCLSSLQGHVGRIIYVDSGSTDGSVEAAKALDAEVVLLPSDQPFTAARARNAGLALLETGAAPEFVQFVDGDCEVHPGWLPVALAFLTETPKAAVVCGRRRERFPEASIYNRLIDAEWDTPIGPARSCGGDALMRLSALRENGGYDPTLIAGEEPELCVRLRQSGWSIHRIDAEMTLHDAAMTRFSQWWKRSTRAGHAYAEGAALHGAPPERHNVAETRRAVVWGLALPALTILLSCVTPWGWALLLIWPLQILRLGLRDGDWIGASFLTLGKFPEATGVLRYLWRRLSKGEQRLIEYK